MRSVSAHVAPLSESVSRSLLDRIFGRAPGITIWVIGDLMLDEYTFGEVARISPEAPVPVVRARRDEDRLGGAANVACQVRALGTHAVLGGLVGQDPAGDRVLHLCTDAQIDVRAVRRLGARMTTRKRRLLAQNQQLLRIDQEDRTPCGGQDVAWMLARLREGPAPDVVVFSDYAKGVITPELFQCMCAHARLSGARVIVDPKQRDFRFYRGADILTPNVRELALAVGHDLDAGDDRAIGTCAQELARHIDADALVVTRGEYGILLAPAVGPCLTIATRNRDLFDPTGAGDTVVAVLATTLASGATLVDAAKVANLAAGVAVGRVGAVSVRPDQILAASGGAATSGKIMDIGQLVERVAQWRKLGRRVVFTNGCFDLLHVGHLALLHAASELGDALIVAVNSDDSVRRLKGPSRPLIPANERAAMLAALDCVSVVTVFNGDTPLAIVEAIRPDVLVKGGDYRIGEVVGRELVEAGGGKVVLVPLVAGKSTTALVDHIVASSAQRTTVGPAGGQ